MTDLQAVLDSIYTGAHAADRRGQGGGLHSRAGQGRSEAVRHGDRHRRRQGLQRSAMRDVPFSIQSVSKVFTLTLALGKVGEGLWKRVGREPSGSAFNSIVQLEHEARQFRAIPSSMPARSPSPMSSWPATRRARRSARWCGSCATWPTTMSIAIDEEVARSETQTGLPQFRARQFHARLRQSRPPGRACARRLFPPMRAVDDLRASWRRPACFWPPRGSNPVTGPLGRLARAGAAHQCADADLRPL